MLNSYSIPGACVTACGFILKLSVARVSSRNFVWGGGGGGGVDGRGEGIKQCCQEFLY